MKDTLLVTPYYDPNIVGGAEISTQLIAESLPGRCDVLTFGRSNRERQVNDVDVYQTNLQKYENIWAAPLDGTSLTSRNKLDGHLGTLWPSKRISIIYRDFIRKHGYKTVVMNANETVMDRPSLWKGAHDSGARVVLTLRDNSLLNKTIGGLDFGTVYRHLIRQQLCWVDAFVAPSQYMIDLYAQSGMAKADNRVIPNAVGKIDVSEVPFEDRSGVIFAGSVTEQKGITTLLEAARYFRSGDCLEIVGRGLLVGMCEDVDSVTVKEWMSRENLYKEIAHRKVLVLPSVWPEAFGRVLVEAVMCGTLVVGSNAGGIPEVLNNDCRYVFEAGNSEQLAKKVNRILGLSEDDYARELRALQEKSRRFSKEHYAEAWAEVLDGGDDR